MQYVKRLLCEFRNLFCESGGTEVKTQDREPRKEELGRIRQEDNQDDKIKEVTVDQMKRWENEVWRQRKEQRLPPKHTMSLILQS